MLKNGTPLMREKTPAIQSNDGACLVDLQMRQFEIIHIFSNCSSRFCVCWLLVVLLSSLIGFPFEVMV